MSNLKHYINGLSSGNSFFTLRKKLNFVTVLLGIFDFLLAGLFWYAGIMPLMLFCFFSGLFFLVLISNLLKKEKYSSALIFSVCEVELMSFACTLCIGFDSGFPSYAFALIAAVFYLTFVIDSTQKKEGVPLILSAFLFLCYLVDYIITFFVDPFYTIDNIDVIRAFHIANYSISFVIVIIFNFLFMWEMKARNRLLSSKNEQLDDLAHRDPLTHLLNRRCMSEYLQESMTSLKTTGKRFSLILADIDNFKHINDTYGHDAGDMVLVNVANIITSSLRDGDAVCRWGGEEILILVHDSIEMAAVCADRIRKNIESNATVVDSKSINVTMTFGVSESIPGYRIEQLIQQADDKLYKGKRNGKNCVVV